MFGELIRRYAAIIRAEAVMVQPIQGGNMNGSDAHPASMDEEISESRVT